MAFDPIRADQIARQFNTTADPWGAMISHGYSPLQRTWTEEAEVELAGTMRTQTRHVIELTFKLPQPVLMGFSFIREEFKHKLTKLFKAEIQVGDKMFDDMVYITTDTPKDVASMLSIQEVRDVVYQFIYNGGHVTLDGQTLTMQSGTFDASSLMPPGTDVGILLACALASQ